MQGRILTVAGVTTAICSAPVVAFLNLVAVAVWPTWIAVAICETLRKVGHKAEFASFFFCLLIDRAPMMCIADSFHFHSC